MPIAYSTLSTSVNYAFYRRAPEQGINVVTREVVVNGGAGVASKHLITPKGVATKLSDEEAELLRSHPLFQLHCANGHVVIEKAEQNIDEVVENMKKADDSAPLTDDDYKPGGRLAPKGGLGKVARREGAKRGAAENVDNYI